MPKTSPVFFNRADISSSLLDTSARRAAILVCSSCIFATFELYFYKTKNENETINIIFEVEQKILFYVA